jgi:hypothetical protein
MIAARPQSAGASPSTGGKIDRAQGETQKNHADFDRKRVICLEHFLEVF